MVMKKIFGLMVLILCAVVLAGCGQGGQELPTIIPVAQLPTATYTPLPATIDIAATRTVEGGVAPTPEVTRPPTMTPTPVDSRINITSPKPNELVFVGNPLTVSGLMESEPGQTISVTLRSRNGRTLAQSFAAESEIGWQTTLTVPVNVTGPGNVLVTMQDEAQNVTAFHDVPVVLEMTNLEGQERYLDLYRPESQETAVGGFNLIFDGEVLRPAGNVVTISVWGNECQERMAQQSFTMGSSAKPFYWQGFVVVPEDLVGPACAVASFGEPGSANWREVQVPIEVLAQDNIEARGVTIGSPVPESDVTAGEEVLFYGSAMNVASGPVSLSILMEDGRIVGGGEAETDYWGYWEIPLFLPPDLIGLAEITVAAGEGDTYAEEVFLINVLPAPTPTPFP